MKQKLTKILTIIIALIVIVGAIIIGTKGLAFELKYQDSQRVGLNLGKEFEKEDIEEITSEIFEGQPVLIQYIEVYKDSVSITTTQITEEQKINLITKLNEKYGAEIKAENVEVEDIANVRGRDIIKPYIVPFVITTAIITVYLIIRYRKLNTLKVIGQTVGIVGLSQIVLLGIMAITRMPVGKFTIPTVILVYILSLYICTSKIEQDLDKIKVKE